MNDLVARWTASGQSVSGESELAGEFDVRLRECSTLVVRVAYSVLRNSSDAEDVAQEAFLRAFRRMSSLRDPAKFKAWIVRMTWRLALDWRRGERRRTAREDAVRVTATAVGSAEADFSANERQARLWDAIDALPDTLRIVTVLAAIEGHDVREVAALVGIPEGTVKSRLFEARRRLQELLR